MRNNNSELFLSHDEVAFLTGRKNAKSQVSQLDKQHISYKLNASGKPIVLRSLLEPSKSKQKAQGWTSNKG